MSDIITVPFRVQTVYIYVWFVIVCRGHCLFWCFAVQFLVLLHFTESIVMSDIITFQGMDSGYLYLVYYCAYSAHLFLYYFNTYIGCYYTLQSLQLSSNIIITFMRYIQCTFRYGVFCVRSTHSSKFIITIHRAYIYMSGIITTSRVYSFRYHNLYRYRWYLEFIKPEFVYLEFTFFFFINTIFFNISLVSELD